MSGLKVYCAGFPWCVYKKELTNPARFLVLIIVKQAWYPDEPWSTFPFPVKLICATC